MQLDELKKNMSVLDQVLAKTSTDIAINVSASKTAQAKLMKQYGRLSICCAALALAFGLGFPGGNNLTFPTYLRSFATIYLAIYALWYIFIHLKLKKIDVTVLTPAKLISETSSIRIMTLAGEAISCIILAVFLSLFLSNLMVFNRFSFWLCIATICIAVLLTVAYYLPRYLRLFRELSSIK